MRDIRDVYSSDSESLPAEKCIGRISSEIRYTCPPGYPILIYGEKIIEEHLGFLNPKENLLVLKEW